MTIRLLDHWSKESNYCDEKILVRLLRPKGSSYLTEISTSRRANESSGWFEVASQYIADRQGILTRSDFSNLRKMIFWSLLAKSKMHEIGLTDKTSEYKKYDRTDTSYQYNYYVALLSLVLTWFDWTPIITPTPFVSADCQMRWCKSKRLV